MPSVFLGSQKLHFASLYLPVLSKFLPCLPCIIVIDFSICYDVYDQAGAV